MRNREVNPVIAVVLIVVVLAIVGYIFYTRGVKREEARGAPPEFYQYQRRGAPAPSQPVMPR
ncbi:MAG: hypothetical protein KatS3mg022_2253 [Armatimonadota bacterium]|nr:MAG: hypothetical protein KatS3mg022_2253 [Armatimonadota bacterium]GIV19355.1 MAG: hypothetical protein KatS3mg023_1106 [Armatimonadota bacterium]